MQIMKLLILLTSIFTILGTGIAFADNGTFVNKVEFIQYSDANTAIHEIRNGHLDMYYSSIPSDLLDDQSKQDLQIFQSTGKSYSLLINPAVSSNEFNPLSIQKVRFALNYLMDRNLIVDEILNGHGAPMISAYKPYDPDYLLLLNELESFNFKYNPALADKMISDSLNNEGAQKLDGHWLYKSKPIEISIFIRNDDPVRKSIGEVLSAQLEKMGFIVTKNYGDLTKAYSIVYGSNPADLKWNIYTEGWSMTGFVRYDSVITAQMYSPWYSNMPGFNNPTYWNFEDKDIDSLSQAIFLGNFTSSEERSKMLQQAVKIGINDSVRIFLACQTDQFVASKRVNGIINDFGAGITSRFTPINARSDSNSLTVGVKAIYQGAWNPVAGFIDAYSQPIWGIVSDPGSFKNPYTGLTIPVRSIWEVKTAGPLGKLDVPKDAIKWNATMQQWIHVGEGAKATSKVTLHLNFGNWHNKMPMDMNDVLYGIYFLYQWGSEPSNGTKTFDSEYSPKAKQAAKTLIGVRIIDKNTIEVYEDYWHFDESEIADSAQVWPAMPWEIMYSMEKAVTDGKFAFSRSDSVSNNIDWLSLIIPDHANALGSNLEEFVKERSIPNALGYINDSNYFISRYQSSISWIKEHNNAVISNGPFYLDSYSPETRTITVKEFVDPTYPIKSGHWKIFEDVNLPKIENVSVPTIVNIGKELKIPVSVTPGSTIYYYFINSQGKVIDHGNQTSGSDLLNITISGQRTKTFDPGSNDLELFAISESAYKPDIYHTSFVAINGEYQIPVESANLGLETVNDNYAYLIALVALISVTGIVIWLWRKRIPKVVKK